MKIYAILQTLIISYYLEKGQTTQNIVGILEGDWDALLRSSREEAACFLVIFLYRME